MITETSVHYNRNRSFRVSNDRPAGLCAHRREETGKQADNFPVGDDYKLTAMYNSRSGQNPSYNSSDL